MTIYGERIREARMLKGWSQKKLADECGTTQQTIQRYESGASEPQSTYLARVSKALDVSVSYLLGMDDDALTEIALSTDELKLIQLYRSTDQRGRSTILAVAESQRINHLKG